MEERIWTFLWLVRIKYSTGSWGKCQAASQAKCHSQLAHSSSISRFTMSTLSNHMQALCRQCKHPNVILTRTNALEKTMTLLPSGMSNLHCGHLGPDNSLPQSINPLVYVLRQYYNQSVLSLWPIFKQFAVFARFFFFFFSEDDWIIWSS